MEDECVGMYHILFYLSFVKRGELIQAMGNHYYFYEKFKSEFVTNESFANSFIAIGSDFM